MTCDESRTRLDALLDGELSPADDANLRAHLAECADCTRDYDAISRTSSLLQGGLVHYQAPDVLRARIHGALIQEGHGAPGGLRWPASWGRTASLIAAGLVIAVASSTATWAVARQRMSSSALADEVLASHIRSLMTGHLIDVASSDQHNVKPWFNGRVDLSPPVPALDSAGFVLVGGRLDYVNSRTVAVVVYGRRQHFVNVYSWPDGSTDASTDAEPSIGTAHGYRLIRWRTGGIANWAVSDVNGKDLEEFVRLYRAGAR